MHNSPYFLFEFIGEMILRGVIPIPIKMENKRGRSRRLSNGRLLNPLTNNETAFTTRESLEVSNKFYDGGAD
jgi:hypothetical protein